ncbi:MAG: hypothetical protein LQ338_002087 [Usnochroma carphineum]|nr:MAG: hypothetical protein LQ338_002087 [Usnochroma carphineum]
MARANDLWDRAVDALSDEDKQAIDFSNVDDKPSILSDLLKAAEEKRQVCMQKRWKYTKKNGEIIILRDVCDKLIGWVNKFKEVGDVAVQYDPAHASLPWAAVRFFLQLSVNDLQTFGAMAEGLETVSSHITRCALYEQLYLSRPSKVRPDLELILLRFYTAILTYLARARRYYAKSTLRRLTASVLVTSESMDASLARIAAVRDEVERCTYLVDSELLRDTSQALSKTQASVDELAADIKSLNVDAADSQESKFQSLKAILVSFEQPILRTATQVSDLHTSLKKEQRRQILSWLSSVRYREHHRSSFSAVMPGSCSWLLHKREYIDWKTSSCSAILWIHGIPGSGKSKLMSTVIHGLLESKSQHMATSAVAYFYCARDAAGAQRADPDEVMRAVLKQIACFDASQPLHSAVLREYNKRERDADEDGLDPVRLSLRECTDLVLEITDQLPAIFIIDALDECDPLRRHELLQALRDIVQKSNNLVKVMVSSRDDADIVCRLNNVPNVYIRSDDNGEDVEKYIDMELEKAISEQRLLKGRVSAHLKERIFGALKDRAGFFGDVEDALLCLPPTLFQLYDVIMKRIDRIASHGRALAKKALRWLLCAREPLTSAVLLEILEYDGRVGPKASHILEDQVLNLCCNLVVLDDTLNVFRFAHASVRDFLEEQPGFESQAINVSAAEEALQYALSEKNLISDIFEGFTAYASRYWIIHYRDLDFNFRTGHPFSSTVKSFFHRGAAGDGIFIWCMMDSKPDVFTLLNDNPAVPFVESDLVGNPFLIACEHGLLEVVDELAHGPDIDLNVRTIVGETGLYIAVRQRYLDVVERLLGLGADPRIPTWSHETALHRAAENGDRLVLLLLLQHGADVMARDDQGWTTLDWGVRGDHEAVVSLLIANGAAEEALQKYGEPLIHWAHPASDGLERQSQFQPLIHRATGCVGIRNEGQTGYLNAILHFLYTLEPFHDLLRRLEEWSCSATVTKLEDLFTTMETSKDIVSTKELTIAFGWGTRQLQQPEDPFELFIVLMDRIGDLTSEYGGTLDSIYNDLFWSLLVYSKETRPAEPALYISVDVYGHQDLEEAIKKDWGPDTDQPESPWCSFGKLAPILVIQLKRFQYNMGKDRLEKRHYKLILRLANQIHSHFTYPARMSLEQKSEPFQLNYVLHGVLVHMGFNNDGGRILIYLKSHSTGKWIRCRNEHVTWATEQEVFDDNFGSGREPERLYESCTASALIYLDERRVDDIARVMVPYGDQI